jgi:hypothetical protein
MTYSVTTTFEVDPKRVQDLIVGAFEGGSNYWLGRGRVELINPPYEALPKEDVVWYGREFNVFAQPDFKITLETDEGLKELTPATVQKGLELMGQLHNRHFRDMLDETDDAETSDVFLQLCLFEEVVYG